MKKRNFFFLVYFILAMVLFVYGLAAWRSIQGIKLLSMGVAQGRFLLMTWRGTLFVGGFLLLLAAVAGLLRLLMRHRQKRRQEKANRELQQAQQREMEREQKYAGEEELSPAQKWRHFFAERGKTQEEEESDLAVEEVPVEEPSEETPTTQQPEE